VVVDAGDLEGARDRGREALAVALVLVGAAGFAFALSSLYLAMADVMVTNGGQCASGGPYQIADGHQCSGSTVGMTLGGIFGMIAAGVVLLVGASRMTGSRMGDLGFVMWAALFGSLGWNFLRLGFDPPDDAGLQWGWIVPGVLFWLMAAPGVVMGLPGALGLTTTTPGGARIIRLGGPRPAGTGTWVATVTAGAVVGVLAAVLLY
jgi:hypothetical protein